MGFPFASLGPAIRWVALGLLFAMAAVGIGVLLYLGGLPGRIAARQGHPDRKAIRICGWVGLLTGVFWIVALIWAYKVPRSTNSSGGGAANTALAEQVSRLESAVTLLEKRCKEATR